MGLTERLGNAALNVLNKMRIEKLVIPTPFPVGPINIYLVVDDPITLVDTGPKTDQAVAALREQLSELGFKTEDVKRIVLTHTHEDHCGLAERCSANRARASMSTNGSFRTSLINVIRESIRNCSNARARRTKSWRA